MVATYSPHRLHVSPVLPTMDSRTPPPVRHYSDKVPRHSPLSSNLNIFSPLFKTRTTARKLTPARTRSNSPFKVALRLSSDSSLNSISNSNSSSETEKSPAQKFSRQTRSMGESKSSPMKRRETIPNEPEAFLSPRPKKRSYMSTTVSATSPSPQLSPPKTRSSGSILHSGLTHTPKRSSSLKRMMTNNPTEKHVFARPLLPPARQPDFTAAITANSQNNNTRLRSMQSFGNLKAEHPSPFTDQPLLNPSIHPTRQNIQPNAFARSLQGFSNSSNQSTQATFATPDYKSVRPLQVAFMSTGLISKRNKPSDESGQAPLQPDTPCKRPTVYGLNKTFFEGQSGANTPFPAKRRGRLSLVRRESTISVDEDAESNGDSQGSFPPTPTKQPSLPGSEAAKSVRRSLSNVASKTRSKRWKANNSGKYSIPRPTRRGILMDAGSPLEQTFQNPLMTPRTPHDPNVFPDPSSLSISGRPSAPVFRNSPIPSTPSNTRDSVLQGHNIQSPSELRNISVYANQTSTPQLNRSSNTLSKEWDFCLETKFDKVDQIGSGKFSIVFQCTERLPTRAKSPNPSISPPVTRSSKREPQVFAVKRIPYSGAKDREVRYHEVEILKGLGKHQHIIDYFTSWEDNMQLYIQTEFCDNGNLDAFLSEYGNGGRLDPFRIWKILAEVTLGLEYLHSNSFIHLDLKPANILIAYDGTLKLGDFGMATKWPASRHLEREGDREYLAPEVLSRHAYDKPADIFALGLIVLEISANIQLPDNGASWHKLRSGDLSEVGSLDAQTLASSTMRDEYGFPIVDESHHEISFGQFDSSFSSYETTTTSGFARLLKNPHFTRSYAGVYIQPPSFMEGNCIYSMISSLIAPNPVDRPIAKQILNTQQISWILQRRTAGALVYEGEWSAQSCDLETDCSDVMEFSSSAESKSAMALDDWMVLED